MDLAESARLHALIVRFSAVSAWLVALALTTVALVTGDRLTLIQAAAAGIAGLAFVLQLLTGKVNALGSMIFGIFVISLTLPLIAGEQSALGASLAIVAMAIVGSLFAPGHPGVYLTIGTGVMIGLPMIWADSASAGLSTGLIMALSFVIGATAFILIRRQMVRSDQQFRWLFERAPVGLVEQDWTDAIDYVASLRPSGIDDLEAMLRADPELIAAVVGRVTVVRANDAAAEILKSPLRQLVGRRMSGRVGEENREVWIRQILGMWVGRPFDSVEYETTDYQGAPGLWLEVRTISMGRGSSRHRVILSVADVTQSRRQSRDLADLVREKDEFIATVSHELRTPLTAVVGLANEVLAADDLTPAERRELLELVVSQANEISHLVEDLLVGARADIGTISIAPEPIDLAREVATVVSALATAVPVESDHGLPPALGDPVRTRQIIRNLAVNAERYGGPSRRIVVTGSEDSAILEVRDNGLPLDPEDRERIFEPYTRAHDRPGVTVSVGLGLSVSRRLAQLMDGNLAYDHDGCESIFRLELPVARPGAAQPAGDPAGSLTNR